MSRERFVTYVWLLDTHARGTVVRSPAIVGNWPYVREAMSRVFFRLALGSAPPVGNGRGESTLAAEQSLIPPFLVLEAFALECQKCSNTLVEPSLFCDACGMARASIVPDEQILRSYCGECGSRLEGPTKCYCVQCGRATIHKTGLEGDSWWKQLMNNPKLQFAIAGLCIALLLIPMWALLPKKQEEDPAALARAKTIRMQVGQTAPERFSAKQLNIHSAEFAGLRLEQLAGVVKDVDGTMYLSDSRQNMIYEVGPDGKQKAFAGTGTAGYSGDRGDADEAELNQPRGLALDGDGNLYIADTGNHVVRVIERSGRIRTIAGLAPAEKAKPGRSSSPARRVELLSPVALSIGLKNEIYVTEDPNANGNRSPSVWILEPEGLPEVSQKR